MSFTSGVFFVFLPVVFFLYWVLPHRYRWVLILIASYYFYMSWNAKYAILIFVSTLISWVCSVSMEYYSNRKIKKFILAIGCVSSFGMLFVFKYFNWFFKCLNTVFDVIGISTHPISLQLILPVGISFFTFQTMGYVIDVYRGNVKVEKNFGVYAAFISFFPQLVAGPIERSANLLPQIKEEHKFNSDKSLDGLKLVLWGYFKKMAIADLAAQYVDMFYADLQSYTGFGCLLAMFMFTIQIYCDFSGYSDIAIGVAKLFDIDLMTNFRSPYLSSSIREFWSRWHISLSTWFRDYVYIPLGGNRCSKLRRSFNMMATMLVSGLWHGADITFIAWGGIHGLAQLVEDIWNKPLNFIRRTAVGRLCLTILCFAFCNFTWVFFRAESFYDAFFVIRHCLDGIMAPRTYVLSTMGKIGWSNMALFVVFVGILVVYDYIDYKKGVIEWSKTKPKIVQWILYLALGVLLVFFSQKGTSVDFVYFQF